MEYFVDAEMDLHPIALKPATPTPREFQRLRHLWQAQDPAIKPAGLLFATGRHRELDMINADDGHALAPPGSRPYGAGILRFRMIGRSDSCTNTHESARYCTMATNLTIRLDNATKKALNKLAKATGRTRAFLAQEALARYLSEQAWQITEIRKAIKKADRGAFATQREVTDALAQWGDDADQMAAHGTRAHN
jgi:predicted transcriptional regulator